MKRPLCVLNLESSAADGETTQRHLERSGFQVEYLRLETMPELLQALRSGTWDVILSDYVLPRANALTALRVLREEGIDKPFIVLSSSANEAVAAETMRAGAHDFISKDNLTRLAPAIEREMEEVANRQQRRFAERAYERSELRFRRLAESNIIGIFVAALDGAILDANDAFLQMLGRTREDLRERLSLDQLTPPEYREWDRLIAKQLRETGVAQPWEKEYLRADGSRIPVLVGMASLDGAEECVAYVVDLTEKRESERALRSTQERLRLAQQAAKIWSWEYNVASNTIVWSDRADLPPQHPRDASYWLGRVHPDDREQVKQAIEASLQRGEDYDIEYRTIGRDGKIRWSAVRGSVFREGGKPVRMLGIGMDITGRKHAEEVMRSTEKLAATGRMAATIAHEINNPLEAVTNLLYLLDNEHGMPERAREYNQMAQQELARVVQIVRQTLGFYRETTAPIPVPMAELVESVLELYNRRIAQNGIAIETELDPQVTVPGFPGELRQVFSNLIINAVEAVPRGGKVRVTVRSSHSRTGSPGVCITVADSGPGIRPEHREKIFEPFFTTKGEKGTGLGLWVSHGIVRKHNGKIRVRSSVQPGRSGTVFSVFLPAGRAARRNLPRVVNG